MFVSIQRFLFENWTYLLNIKDILTGVLTQKYNIGREKVK